MKKKDKIPETKEQKKARRSASWRHLGKVALLAVGIMLVVMAGVFINNKVQLSKEAELLTPLGQMVEVRGKEMCVYSAGEGDKTLVFLSGNGACSPILDFKSLDSRLVDTYKVAVVERFGYGFSDDTDESRDVDTVLEECREALTAAGVEGPYVLCPHSLSAIQALYWAQKYPDEVEAIVGLDMALPKVYEGMSIDTSSMRSAKWAIDFGLVRLSSDIADGAAVVSGDLTEEEKEIYRAVFYRSTYSDAMLAEADAAQANAKLVDEGETPSMPIRLFVSNGSGTGFDQETWQAFSNDFAQGHDNISVQSLDCGHYIHDLAYEDLAQEIKDFLGELDEVHAG